MSESHVSTLLLGLVGHGHLRSFNDLDQIDGLTAMLSLARTAIVILLLGSVNEVSFVSAKAWSEVYGQKRVAGAGASSHGHDFLENAKDSVFFKHATLPDSILAMEKSAHVAARKNLGSAFSAKAVADQESIVMGHFDMMMKLMHDAVKASAETKSAVDVAAVINWALFDVIGDLGFGEPFGSLANAAEHEWVSTLPTAIKSGAVRANVICLLSERLGGLATKYLISKDVREKLDWHRGQAKDKFDRRRTQGQGRPDFMSPMFEDPELWTYERMRGTITTLIAAGSETSSTTLASAIYYLSSVKAAPGDTSPLEKLRAEIDAHFTSDDQINFNSVRNLPYLSAVLDETMRLRPPAVTTFPREAREGGVVVEGYYFPEKTVLGIPQYAMFHCKRNFHLPEQFVPERFLGNDSRFAGDRKDAFQPFSYGPHNCIGRCLAYAETRTILSRIVFSFDFELRPESAN